MLQHIFSFEGRIRRKEYGITFLVYLVIVVTANLTLLPRENSYGIYEGGVENGPIYYLLILLPCLYVLWAQGAKRCHDINKSGWWQLIPFYVFVLLFTDSHHGVNEYGENPKGEGNLEQQFDFLREPQQSAK